MKVTATRPSAWSIPLVLAACELGADPDNWPGAAASFDRLATLGLNLAIAGALCASYEIGLDPPVECVPVPRLPDAVTVAMWHPGCGRPFKRETRIEPRPGGHDGGG
jgi:hypothetical protein